MRSGDRAGLVPKGINTQPAFKMKSQTVSYKEQFKGNKIRQIHPLSPKRETEKGGLGLGLRDYLVTVIYY